MNKDIRSIFYFLVFFDTVTDFFSAFILSGTYLAKNKFPDAGTLLSISYAYSEAVHAMGGKATGLFAWVNIFQQFLEYVATPTIFIFNVFSYIFSSLSWIYGLLNYPFQFVPYPFNLPLQILMYAFFGITIITTIRIVSSGLSG